MSLQLLRLTPTGKYALLAEATEGEDDVTELVRCFLTDPRDDITAVYLYDKAAQQFRGVIRRGERKRRAAA